MTIKAVVEMSLAIGYHSKRLAKGRVTKSLNIGKINLALPIEG